MAPCWLQPVPWEHRATLHCGSTAHMEQVVRDVAELPAWEGEGIGTAEMGLCCVMLGVSCVGSRSLELVSF